MTTFKKGVHPKGNKSLTENKALEVFPAPRFVYIPVSQHIGAPAEPVVSAGDKVSAGTLIAAAKGFVSSNVYSGISGIVKGTEKRVTATGNITEHIIIENDFLQDEEFLPDIGDITGENLLQRIGAAGIVGMGGATFPVHVKLNPSKQVDTLIINGAECEPYITCDYRLMIEHSESVTRGAALIGAALGVKRIVIAVEDNKPQALDLLSRQNGAEVIPVKTKYPQGAEKQLIYSITKRKVPVGGLPMDVGVVVSNVHTAFAVNDAVTQNRPLYRRAMTVSGRACSNPCNIWTPNGVPFSEIATYARSREPYTPAHKIISGGPMMGFAQASMSAVTTKGSGSLLFLTREECGGDEHSACINCGKCAGVCPMNLMPMYIDSYTASRETHRLIKYNAASCIECGSCAYVCPAKRPLVQSMRLAKILIREKGGK